MPTLSVIIPVFNEAANLERFFRELVATPCPVEREWIVVDDHSTDGSVAILERLQPIYQFQLVLQPKNQGKGRCIRVGISVATGDWIVIQDADFEYDPNEIPRLLEPLMPDRADVVYGSRFRPNANQVHRTYHYFVNWFLTMLSNALSGIFLTDMETCYKLFRSDLLKSMNLQSNRFGIEVELTAYVAKSRARVMELPISYYPRTYLQGKKINWKDGIAALYHLVYFNWVRTSAQSFTKLPERYS